MLSHPFVAITGQLQRAICATRAACDTRADRPILVRLFGFLASAHPKARDQNKSLLEKCDEDPATDLEARCLNF